MQVTLGGGGGSHKEPNLVGFPLVFYMAKFGRANEPMGSDTPAMYTWILCRVLYLAYILLSRYIVKSNVGIAGILFQNCNYILSYVCTLDAVGSSQIFFPTQNLERAY